MTATVDQLTFAEVVDAADRLSAEEQEELIAVIRRRLAEAGRERVRRESDQARAEYKAGKARAMSVNGIMKEITS